MVLKLRNGGALPGKSVVAQTRRIDIFLPSTPFLGLCIYFFYFFIFLGQVGRVDLIYFVIRGWGRSSRFLEAVLRVKSW